MHTFKLVAILGGNAATELRRGASKSDYFSFYNTKVQAACYAATTLHVSVETTSQGGSEN